MANPSKAAELDSEPKPATRPNLRHYQRITTRFSALIARKDASISGEQALSCQLTNLSRAGVMAVCTPEVVASLLPKGAVLGPRQGVRVKIQFELPVISVQKVVIDAHCDVVYLRRDSREVFHLGMSFISFEHTGQDYIDQFIDRQLNRPVAQ